MQLNIQDGHLKSLPSRQLKKSTICCVRDRGTHSLITWIIGLDFEYSRGYEKVFHKLGAAFAQN